MEAKRPCCGGNFLFEIRNHQIDALAMSPLQKSTWQRSHTVALWVHGSPAKDFLLRFSTNISMRWPFLTVRLLHFEIRNHWIDVLAMRQLPKSTWQRTHTVALCVHGSPAKDFLLRFSPISRCVDLFWRSDFFTLNSEITRSTHWPWANCQNARERGHTPSLCACTDFRPKIFSRATDYWFTLGFLHKAQSRAMGNTADT